MFQIAIFLALFSKSLQNIHYVSEFLTNLETSENLHSTYILRLDNSQYTDEMMKSLTLPTITIQDGLQINYLNFKKYKSVNNSLKFYFNQEFMTVLIAESLNESIFLSESLKEIACFSRDRILILITDRFCNNWINVIIKFRFLKFWNVLYLDIENFQRTQEFRTFEIFSKYSAVAKREFAMETISNVEKLKIKVACNNQFPTSQCSRKNDKIQGIGSIFKVIENFVQFINGSMELTVEEKEPLNTLNFDLWTKMEITALNGKLLVFPLDFEIFSNILEKYEFFVIIPKARFINDNLYIIKPISSSILVLICGYLLYGSIVFNLALFIIKEKIEFWKTFSQLLRSLLSQTFSKPFEGYQISFIYLLAIFLGYILTIWYSALLGSFFTTFIRESQISTLDELRESNIRIVLMCASSYNTFSFNEIVDLLTFLPPNERMPALEVANRSYGFIITTNEWEISSLSDNYFKIKKFSLESTFLRVSFHLHSIYKNRFNRFINIIQDSGLYNYWKERSYYDWLKIENEEIILPMRRNFTGKYHSRRILTINYFTFPFIFFIVGCLFGVLAFSFEVFAGNFEIILRK